MKDNSSAFNSSIYDSKVNAVLPYYTEYNKQILDLAEASGIKTQSGLIRAAARVILHLG